MRITRTTPKAPLDIREISKYGWDHTKLNHLANILQTVVKNFDTLTNCQNGYRIIFVPSNKDNPRSMFNIYHNLQTIRVFLQEGPKFTTKCVPLLIGKKLIDNYFETDPDMSELFLSISGKIIPQLLKSINQVIKRDRNDISDLLVEFCRDFGMRAVKLKMAFGLIKPYALSSAPLSDAIIDIESNIRKKAIQIEAETDLDKVWNDVASLAFHYMLAVKLGLTKEAAICRDAVAGEVGRHIAITIILNRDGKALLIEGYTIENELAGINSLFLSLSRAFELYYDSEWINSPGS
ncbi:MAG: hypothetical protein U9R38_05530 [Candidatus Margulisiibacteriota bacterium]|nr:hypothetical protein [Candidatus Margulisiibacteriota bacterium]